MVIAKPAKQDVIRPETTVRVDLYTHTSEVWYEDPGIRHLDSEFLAIVRRIMPAAPFRRSNIWVHVGASVGLLPREGWKIHLSSSDRDAADVLSAAAKICRAHGVQFKFLGDRWQLSLANSKMWPREASGKFVVLYPTSTEQFLEIGRALDEILQDRHGPYVLSDRRFGKSQCVYYRYGGFIQHTSIAADGTRVPLYTAPSGEMISDQRRPYFWLPPGCSDPVHTTIPRPVGESSSQKSNRICIAGRFVVETALASGHVGFTSAGGVYRATDIQTKQTVVLKEARPFIGNSDGPLGYAIESLEREYELLAALEGTGVAPRAFGLFWDSGQRHRFLAEEFVKGASFGTVLISLNPNFDHVFEVSRRESFIRFLRIAWKKLAETIAAIHAKGVCIGDLSFNNIIVNNWESDLELKIIDFEGGWFIGQPSSRVCTPGFSFHLDSDNSLQGSKGELDKRLTARGPEDDLFSLGRILLGSLLPATSMAILDKDSANRLFAAAAVQLGVPEAMFKFIMRLTSRNVGERPSASEVAEYFENPECFHGVPPAMPIVPIEKDADEFRAAIGAHIIASGNTTRVDRVFPADPRVYMTNGVNLAYGITGVIHALLAAGLPVHSSYRNWLFSQTLDPERLSPGLFTGLGGIAAVLSELNEDELAISTMLDAARHRVVGDDPFVSGGAAGVGLAALWLYGRTKSGPLLNEIDRIAKNLTGNARGIDGTRWTTPGGDIPVGMLYGTSGVSLFLLYASLATGNEKYKLAGEEAIRITLDSHVNPTGRDYWTFPSYANKGGKRLRHYWADGSAGIGAVLLRWIKATGSSDYELALHKLLPDTMRNITIFPSLLFGMSGLGMFHIDVFRFRGSQASLDICDRYARNVSLFSVKRPDGIGIPGEQLQRLSTDFATGAAGVLMFLSQLKDARNGDAPRTFGVAPFPDYLLNI